MCLRELRPGDIHREPRTCHQDEQQSGAKSRHGPRASESRIEVVYGRETSNGFPARRCASAFVPEMFPTDRPVDWTRRGSGTGRFSSADLDMRSIVLLMRSQVCLPSRS